MAAEFSIKLLPRIWHSSCPRPRAFLHNTPTRINPNLKPKYARWATVDSKQDDRERVVILGSGWAGYVFSRDLNAKKYKPIVISPRSYFVFTPLLNEATVGTTEFRSITEPVRKRGSGVELYQGWADTVDFQKKIIDVEEAIFDPTVTRALLPESGAAEKPGISPKTKGETFQVSYDKLVITVGAYAQTFGTKGVKEHAMFLKDVGDGRKIRKRVLELFEAAGLPTFNDDLRRCLLHFAIVGGGPTGMEYAAELRDLIHEDLAKIYPELMKFVKISVYDVAPKVLPMFDENLASYAMQQFGREGINIKTSHHVEELRRGLPKNMPPQPVAHEARKGGCYTLKTEEEGEVGIGMCVWSTGNAANPFLDNAFGKPIELPTESAIVQEGESPKKIASAAPSEQSKERVSKTQDFKWKVTCDPKTGSLVVTDRFQVQLETETPNESEESHPTSRALMRDVFAMGDCAVLATGPLPATAQVANQEAKWLAGRFNKDDLDQRTFNFKDLGVMTYLGNQKALVQGGAGSGESTGGREKKHTFDLKGKHAYALWKGAYLSMVISWKNRVLVWVHWVLVKMFGRDVTRF